jgi:hypothetical protein
MATTTHGSLAAAAASHLARGGNIIPISRGGAAEIRSQSQQLLDWATTQGCVIDYIPPSDARRSGGAEHDVFFHKDHGRVFKRTKPNTFGSIKTEIGIRKTATPYFYLKRLEWTNEVFGSDLKLEGVINKNGISVLISQPWAYPADPKNPLPADEEIFDFMKDMEFEAVRSSYHEWFRGSDSFHACDARPDNFIKSKQGVIPIDLIVSKIPDFQPRGS